MQLKTPAERGRAGRDRRGACPTRNRGSLQGLIQLFDTVQVDTIWAIFDEPAEILASLGALTGFEAQRSAAPMFERIVGREREEKIEVGQGAFRGSWGGADQVFEHADNDVLLCCRFKMFVEQRDFTVIGDEIEQFVLFVKFAAIENVDVNRLGVVFFETHHEMSGERHAIEFFDSEFCAEKFLGSRPARGARAGGLE